MPMHGVDKPIHCLAYGMVNILFSVIFKARGRGVRWARFSEVLPVCLK